MPGVFGISKNIRYVDRRDLERCSRYERATTNCNRVLFGVLLVFRREAVVRREVIKLAMTKKDLNIFCLA